MNESPSVNSDRRPGQPGGQIQHYGGQAVIEGVMMRGSRHMAVAVRQPDGQIRLKSEALRGLYTGRARSLPVLRGAIILWETMALGLRALAFSSQVAMGLEEGEKEEEPTSAYIWGMMGVALALATAVFFVGPVLLTGWLQSQLHNGTLVAAIEGVIRLFLVLGYIWAHRLRAGYQAGLRLSRGRAPDDKRLGVGGAAGGGVGAAVWERTHALRDGLPADGGDRGDGRVHDAGYADVVVADWVADRAAAGDSGDQLRDHKVQRQFRPLPAGAVDIQAEHGFAVADDARPRRQPDRGGDRGAARGTGGGWRKVLTGSLKPCRRRAGFRATSA